MRKNRGRKPKVTKRMPCILCGENKVKSHVHHNIPQCEKTDSNKHLIYSESNEVPLCPNCHLGLVHDKQEIKILGWKKSTRGNIIEIEHKGKNYYAQNGEFIEV